jgi:hypothetical protein
LKYLALLAFAACKTQVVTTDAGPLPSASVPVTEIAPSASTIPSASTSTTTCSTDADCVAVPTACCRSIPSNRASIEAVRKVADGMTEGCKTRVCAMRVDNAACVSGHCVVR